MGCPSAYMALQSFKLAVGRWNEKYQEDDNQNSNPWEDLKHYINALHSHDKVLKAETLQLLSKFLLCVSSPSHFKCPDMYTVCVCVGDRNFSFKLHEVQKLFDLLFSDLKRFSDSFFEASYKCYSHNLCSYAEMEVAQQVLHCSIRILPLLEFNTSLSLIASEVLGSLLLGLCCKSTIYKFIVAGDMSSGPTPDPTVSSCGSFPNHHHVSDMSTHASSFRVACALIEVFMDELLLWPELAEALCEQYIESEIRLSLKEKHGKDMGLCMIAAFSHLMISSLEHNVMLTSAPALSLPAAVALLDASIIDNLPYVFIAHIGFLVGRILDMCDSCTCPSELVLGLASSVLETAVELYSGVVVVPRPQKSSVECDSPLRIVLKILLENYGDVLATHIAEGYSFQLGFDGMLKEAPYVCWKGQVTRSGQNCSGKCISILLKSKQVTGNCDHLQESRVPDSLNARFAVKKECIAVEPLIPCNLYNSCISNPLIAILNLIGSALHRLVNAINRKQVSSSTHLVSSEEELFTGNSNYSSFFEFMKEIFRFCVPKGILDIHSQSAQTDATNTLSSEVEIVILHALRFFLDKFSLELRSSASEFSLSAHLRILDSLSSILILVDKKGIEDLDARMLQNLIKNLQQKPMCHENVSTLATYLLKVLHGNDTHKKNANDEQQEPPENAERMGSDKASFVFKTSTLDIFNKYKQKCYQATIREEKSSHRLRSRLQDSGDCCLVQSSDQDCNKQEVSGPNTYIQEALKEESENKVPNADTFEDLNDFIKCKKGRDYSKWFKSRMKLREKRYHRLHWKRKDEKKQLVALLSISDKII